MLTNQNFKWRVPPVTKNLPDGAKLTQLTLQATEEEASLRAPLVPRSPKVGVDALEMGVEDVEATPNKDL